MHIVAAVLPYLALQTTLAAPEADLRRDWLKQHALPVKTVQAESGFEDLAGLAAMIGDARIVGLGEGTHGTREHFQMKHRLVEHLVTQLGFSIFAIEANMPEAQELDAYVLGGEGDVERLIGGMYFWTWNTEEVRDLVEWMRRFNAAEKARNSPRRVHFTGFDMQTGSVALAKVREFLEAHEPERAKQHADTFEALASFDASGPVQNDFGCATYRFPIEQARGKQLRLSGWIKTEALENGWAGLWMRVDGPQRQFDNMLDRGLRGSTEWTAASVEFDVPENATDVYLGLVMPGYGRAWFDDLRLELDGVAWSSPELDLGFDGAAPKGLVQSDPVGRRVPTRYVARFDAEILRSGKQSFRIESPAKDDAPAVAELKRQWHAVVEHLLASRARYAELAGEEQAKWVAQNAAIVAQWIGLASAEELGSAHRDRCMAANVRWLARENPDARIVLWAHNAHVSNAEHWMGAHLREEFGEDYVNVAFTSSRGTYYAMSSKGSERVHKLQDAPPESFEAILETAGFPYCLVDLRTAKLGDPASGWLAEAREFGGHIGALAMDQHYYQVALVKQYDLLVYMRETTPARQLESRTGRR